MNTPDLPTQIRELIRRARETPPRLTLTQIAELCDVRYASLWRFTRRENPSNTLQLDEADSLLTTLTKYLEGK